MVTIEQLAKNYDISENDLCDLLVGDGILLLKIQDQYELTEVGIDNGCAYTCKNGTLEIVFPDDLFGELGYQPPSRDWLHELNVAMTKIVRSFGG